MLWIHVYRYFFETLFSILLGIYTQKWSCWIIWLILFLILWGLPHCFPLQLYHFTFLFPVFPHPCQHLLLSAVWIIVILIDMSEVVSYSFNLHFPNDQCLSIFSYVYWPFVYLLQRNIYSSPFELSCLFLFLLSFCFPLIGHLWLHLGPTWIIQSNLPFSRSCKVSFPIHGNIHMFQRLGPGYFWGL